MSNAVKSHKSTDKWSCFWQKSEIGFLRPSTLIKRPLKSSFWFETLLKASPSPFQAPKNPNNFSPVKPISQIAQIPKNRNHENRKSLTKHLIDTKK